MITSPKNIILEEVLIGLARQRHREPSQRYNEYVKITKENFNILTQECNIPIPEQLIRMDPWEIRYLYKIAQTVNHGILEIGRYNGGSLLVLALASSLPKYSIDILPQDDTLLKQILNAPFFDKNVQLIVGDSQTTKYQQINKYDLLFVDGDHSSAGCLNDLNNWWGNLEPGGHVICHDCYKDNHPMNQVQRAVMEFSSQHKVEWVLSPNIPYRHWKLPNGSLCHFKKPLTNRD